MKLLRNNNEKVILASLIALASASAFAEPTAVLKVHGTLTNAACTPSIGNGGVIDYGYIRLGELSALENNNLGQKQVPVTITCSSPTKVGFTILDNRSDSNARLPVDIGKNLNQSVKYYTYGVGTTSEGVNIGDYGMWMTDVTADGKVVDPIVNNHDWNPDIWKKAVFRVVMRSRPSPLLIQGPPHRWLSPQLTLTLLLI